MRSFEDWVKEVEDKLKEGNYPFTIHAILDALKINRTTIHLLGFMRWLHELKLYDLIPTQEEVEYWIKQGFIRSV